MGTIHRLAVAGMLAITQAFPVLAQDPGTPSLAGEGVPALWLLQDEDTRIYLFGTSHSIPADVDLNDKGILHAARSADVIMPEIDPDELKKPEYAAMVIARATAPEGERLQDLLTSEQLKDYERSLSGLGFPADIFNTYDPWFAAVSLSGLELNRARFVQSGIYQKVREAAPATTRIEPFEEGEEQIAVLDDMPVELQVSFLMEQVGKAGSVEEMTRRLVSAWSTGDTARLAGLMEQDLKEPALLDTLIYRRSDRYAECIAERLEEPGTVFVIVGAALLAGERSIQTRLRLRGLEVVRVQ